MKIPEGILWAAGQIKGSRIEGDKIFLNNKKVFLFIHLSPLEYNELINFSKCIFYKAWIQFFKKCIYSTTGIVTLPN